MFCTNCGHKFSFTDVTFCTQCGKKVSSAMLQKADLMKLNNNNVKQKKEPIATTTNHKDSVQSKKDNVYLFAGIAAVLAAVVFVIVLINRDTGEMPTPPLYTAPPSYTSQDELTETPPVRIFEPTPIEFDVESDYSDDLQQAITNIAPASDFTYLYDAALGGVEILRYIGTSSDVRIPDTINGDTVKVIGGGAFQDNRVVLNVVIPDTVIRIRGGQHGGAFSGSAITSVSIPNSVVGIEGAAFQGSNLHSVTIPDSVETLGIRVFEGNTNLTSVTFGQGLTEIPDFAFSNTGITEVVIPSGIERIGTRAFCRNSNLRNVTIPNTVVSIGSRAFEGATALTSVMIPNSVVEIGSSAFRGTGLTRITIPGSKEVISSNAFSHNENLSSITIEYGVTTLAGDSFRSGDAFGGFGAFSSNHALTSVTIPDSVTHIGSEVFAFCSNLRDLTLPNSISNIHRAAFTGSRALTVTFRGQTFNHETFGELVSLINNR